MSRRPRSGVPEDESTRSLILTLDPVDRGAVVELLRDELARGWVPKKADLDAALAVVRGRLAPPSDPVAH